MLDVASGKLHQVAASGGVTTPIMFAKFAPDGSSVAYVRNGDLYVEPATGGAATRLTRDATKTLVNGMSDWVYEEEFGLRDGFRWSPDSRHIAFWQFDMSGVPDFTLINDTDSLYPSTKLIQYPKAGQTNSAVRVGVVSVSGGPVTWAQLGGDPRQDYVPWMEWATPTQVAVQHMNRLQNHNDLILFDAATGAPHKLLTDQDSTWVNVVEDFRWLDGGRHFVWVSERDGWRHVYIGSRDSGTLALATPGDYDVLSIAGVDERGGNLYVIASPENATQRYLYRVSLTHPSAPQRVTPAGETGTHSYEMSPTGAWAFHTYSTFDTPPVTELVRLPSHAAVRTLASNAALKAATAAQIARTPVEFIHVPVSDGTTLDGWIIKPANFDPARKYPVLIQVYGEPASQTVVDRWGGTGMLWHRMLADQGYVIASFDPRGTPAPKGRAWRKVIYGAIGPISSHEVADAVRAAARQNSFMDSTRVAIWGWSGGGSSTLNAMFRYPDVYKVGMAVAPVADQHLYDSIYEERYVGLPQTNPQGYEVGSPINFAAGLKGKLLIVHGSGDDNVHYQGTERLVNKLVSLDKPFDLMVYPNRSHCICEGTGTTLHVYSLLTRYLMTNLPPNAPAGAEAAAAPAVMKPRGE